ncbi:MAG: hypothetical protein IJ566_04710 [Cardiobacteriaceae bacterium]|nr:hypothetical protein [Cardiobacteriaceae bacterium]
MKEVEELIDKLFETDCYVVDYLPQRVSKKMHERYSELEDYFLTHYLDKFSKDIAEIVLKLLAYFPAEIYVGQYPEKYNGQDINKYPFGKNLVDLPFEKIAKLIQKSIRKGHLSTIVLFRQENSMLSISSQFSVYFYNPSKKFLTLTKTLAQSRGVFVWKAGNK